MNGRTLVRTGPRTIIGKVWHLLLAWGVVLYFLTGGLGYSAPVRAQSEVTVQRLTISLWPEYDDPRLLVILNGTLSQANVTLRVPLPEKAQFHAAAYADEDGTLLTAAWSLETVGGRRYIQVTVPTSQFHVEYYLDAVVPGEETVVQARIPLPDLPVEQAVLIAQEPANTTNFRGNPPLGPLAPGANGLRYASRDLGALPAGAVVAQELRYRRLAPGLSAPPPAATASQASPFPEASSRAWWPIAVGGILALVVAGVVIVWLRRQSLRAIPSPGSDRHQPISPATLPRYCPQCGHPFGPHDRYCAMCGTRRPGV